VAYTFKRYFLIDKIRNRAKKASSLHQVSVAHNPSNIRRIRIQSQSWQTVHKTYLKKNPSHTQKRACRVVQGAGPEFKPQYCKKQKQRKPHFHKFLDSIYDCEFIFNL
jgi:hypothetical protein